MERQFRNLVRSLQPEDEVDESELAANLGYLEAERLQNHLVENLSLIHTRHDLRIESAIQEFENACEAGGCWDDNPDLLIPEIDANQVIAAGIWETYQAEQEYLLNPEGFPTDEGNYFGTFISIEDDLGIDTDLIHAVAAMEELNLIHDFELSQSYPARQPP